MTIPKDTDKSSLRDHYESLVVMLIFLNFVWLFVFQAFKIPTPSMVDNLLVGDHLFVNKFIYGPSASAIDKLFPLREVQRGDIVVFRFPMKLDTDYVKRVIGLPGEQIEIRDKRIFVNGKLLPEQYTIFRDAQTYPLNPSFPEPFRSRDQFGPVTVPADSYFVMGDNRDESYDSRYWGTVPRALMKGRPFIVYWSFRSDTPTAETGSAGEKLKQLLDVVVNFFSKTRWDRTFFVVDSRYHYVE